MISLSFIEWPLTIRIQLYDVWSSKFNFTWRRNSLFAWSIPFSPTFSTFLANSGHFRVPKLLKFWESSFTSRIWDLGDVWKFCDQGKMLLMWEHEWRHQYSQFSLCIKNTHHLSCESCQQFTQWVNYKYHDWPLTCIFVEHSYTSKHSQPCCDVRVDDKSEVSSPVSAIPEDLELKSDSWVVVMAQWDSLGFLRYLCKGSSITPSISLYLVVVDGNIFFVGGRTRSKWAVEPERPNVDSWNHFSTRQCHKIGPTCLVCSYQPKFDHLNSPLIYSPGSRQAKYSPATFTIIQCYESHWNAMHHSTDGISVHPLHTDCHIVDEDYCLLYLWKIL